METKEVIIEMQTYNGHNSEIVEKYNEFCKDKKATDVLNIVKDLFPNWYKEVEENEAQTYSEILETNNPNLVLDIFCTYWADDKDLEKLIHSFKN